MAVTLSRTAAQPKHNRIADHPPTTNPIGTAHPTHLWAVAGDGSWLVICQTRRDTDGDGKVHTGLGHHGDFHGDDIEPYLVLGSGAGEPIDTFVGADPSDRYLAYVQKGRLVLLDSRTRRQVNLEASSRDDPNPLGPHRAGDFDEQGRRFLYIRQTLAGERVVIRDLASGSERVLNHGGGKLWRASFAGDYVLALLRPQGKMLPQPRTTLAARRCRGPVISFSIYHTRGARPIRRLLPPGGGSPVNLEGTIAVRGDRILRRLSDQSIVWEAADGGRIPIVPADCGGKVLNTWKGGGPVLTACAGRGKLAPLVWFSNHGSRRLPLSIEAEGDASSVARTWSWHAEHSYFVDMVTGTMIKLGHETRMLASRGDKVYLHRSENEEGHRKEWTGYIDWRSGTARTLPYRFPDVPEGEVGGPWWVLRPTARSFPGPVIDMDSGRVVAGVDRAPLAISDTGWVLMPSLTIDGELVAGPPHRGPLQWYRPGKAPTAAPESVGQPLPVRRWHPPPWWPRNELGDDDMSGQRF
jgi:hypothetical protein